MRIVGKYVPHIRCRWQATRAACGFASFSAAAAMHRSSAATWASKNVRINCVAAGLMDAPSSGDVSQDEVMAKASAEVGLEMSAVTACIIIV